MTTDVLVHGANVRIAPGSAVLPLARTEARRLIRSPALVLYAAYFVVTALWEAVFADRRGSAWTAIGLATMALFLLGPLTFAAAHLASSAARRGRTAELLMATPVDQRRRDLGLCLGVLAGPATFALALAGTSALLAGDGVSLRLNGWPWTVGPWTWTDIAQVPAIVLGAGILGVVVERWFPFPGSLLVGLYVMCQVAVWLQATRDALAVRPWLAPYVVITWWNDGAWELFGSQAWHLAYLLALSGLGVCAVALRQRERRTGWLIAGSVAVATVVATGLLQLP